MEKVVIQDSPIRGRGVFAAQRIEPGEIIIDGCREILSDEQVAALPTEERGFVSTLSGRNILMRFPSRFLNHSCNPNARGTDQHDVAVRVIEAGEEITVDYTDEVDRRALFPYTTSSTIVNARATAPRVADAGPRISVRRFAGQPQWPPARG